MSEADPAMEENPSPDRTLYWDDVPVGHTHEWRLVVTQDAVNAYCDGAEDYNPWYGPDGSPFGPPVVPPMLISRLCRFTTEPLGVMRGWVHLEQSNEILAAVPVGTELHFHAEVTGKEVRRGRALVHERARVTNAAGEELLRQTRTYMAPRVEAAADD